MKITIETVPHGWKVTAEEDGRFLLNQALTSDEALWSVSQVLNEVKPRYLVSPMENVWDRITFARFCASKYNELEQVFGGSDVD